MDNLDAFLLNMKIDLDSTKEELERTNHLQPYRHIFYMEFLMPVGLKAPSYIELMKLNHCFIPESENHLEYRSAVIHGHNSDKGCAGPKMCHLYGFWPTREMSPRFKKIFEARWKPVYSILKWEIPK